MKELLIVLAFLCMVLVLIFYIEEMVSDLPDNNRIKIWWRKHMVGIDTEDINTNNEK